MSELEPNVAQGDLGSNNLDSDEDAASKLQSNPSRFGFRRNKDRGTKGTAEPEASEPSSSGDIDAIGLVDRHTTPTAVRQAPSSVTSSGAGGVDASRGDPGAAAATSGSGSAASLKSSTGSSSVNDVKELSKRVEELESIIAADRQKFQTERDAFQAERDAFQAERDEFLTRPRLQDLGPEELAGESLGAVAEIIKAARAQSSELKKQGKLELDQAREDAKTITADAEAQAEQVRAQAESKASELVSKTRAQQDLLVAQTTADAASTLQSAKDAAENLIADANRQRQEIIAEAQARLESASNRARKAVENANAMAQSTLESARVASAQTVQEGRQSARLAVAQCIDIVASQSETLSSLKRQVDSMRTAFVEFGKPIVTTFESAESDLTRVASQADAAALFLDQTKIEIMLQLEQLKDKAPLATAPVAQVIALADVDIDLSLDNLPDSMADKGGATSSAAPANSATGSGNKGEDAEGRKSAKG